MPVTIRTINPSAPDPATFRETADVLVRGGVVVLPTSGLYGLAANIADDAAVSRVFSIKRRAAEHPIPVLIPHHTPVTSLTGQLSNAANILINRFWPGRLTLVFPAADSISPVLTAGTGKIGLRRPKHPAAAAVLECFGGPITGTSANISGRPGCRSIETLDSEIAAMVDCILDAGPLTGVASTVVDVTGETPVILREGALPPADILAALPAPAKAPSPPEV